MKTSKLPKFEWGRIDETNAGHTKEEWGQVEDNSDIHIIEAYKMNWNRDEKDKKSDGNSSTFLCT